LADAGQMTLPLIICTKMAVGCSPTAGDVMGQMKPEGTLDLAQAVKAHSELVGNGNADLARLLARKLLDAGGAAAQVQQRPQ
jgi:hypothetical protein